MPCPCKCIGCRENPLPPQEKVINGVMHHSIKPACHPNADTAPFVRGAVPEKKPDTPLRSKKTRGYERVSGFSELS